MVDGFVEAVPGENLELRDVVDPLIELEYLIIL